MKQKKTAYERRQSRRRMLVGAVAALMALLMLGGVLVSSLQAFAITKSEVDALKKKAEQATAKKKELKNELSSLNQDIGSLSKQITLLDGQIEAQEEEIAAQEELLAQLNVLIDEKTIQLEESIRERDQQYDDMKLRIRYMAEHGNTSYLTVLLASDSFSDFLYRYEVIRQISLRDEELFEQLKLTGDKVAAEKNDLETARTEAAETKKTMEANRAELVSQQEEKVAQQKKLSSAQSDVKKAYADMIETEDKLMAQYKKAAADYASKTTYVGGKFMWPLPASNNVITCKYGMRKHPVTGKYKLHSGIDLRAKSGTKVYAANGGTVTTSGYSSAWGNYIIINHGGGYTTLYAHLSRRLVAKGDKVKQGATIGLSGNTGYSTGPHLHFEINKNGKPYNPMTEFKGFSVTYK